MNDANEKPLAGTQVSVVIPVYNEQDSLEELYAKLTGVLEKTGRTFELILVDDGSTDRSAQIIADLHRRDPRVRMIRFRRNFGKSPALSAGFAFSRGDLVFTMDADLQDDPEEIPAFIARLEEGFDLVSGWKHRRQDPLSKLIPSRLFNYVTSLVSGLRLHDFNCGFKLYRGEVARSLNIYGELHRYLPALVHFQGYRVTEIKVRHHRRTHGVSKFGSSRLVKGYLDLLTVLFLNRYTRRPLHLFGTLGSLFTLIGFLIGCYFVGFWIVHHNIGGRLPLLLFAVFLMLGGIQLISTGLIGEMLTSSREYANEPVYRIAEVLDSGSGQNRPPDNPACRPEDKI
jgi:glycosyltransferase involved in cell wall biosynthesis